MLHGSGGILKNGYELQVFYKYFFEGMAAKKDFTSFGEGIY